MTARFNPTIIAATDPTETASFYRDLLEADGAASWGPFVNVQLADGVLLQFATPPVKFPHSRPGRGLIVRLRTSQRSQTASRRSCGYRLLVTLRVTIGTRRPTCTAASGRLGTARARRLEPPRRPLQGVAAIRLGVAEVEAAVHRPQLLTGVP